MLFAIRLASRPLCIYYLFILVRNIKGDNNSFCFSLQGTGCDGNPQGLKIIQSLN